MDSRLSLFSSGIVGLTSLFHPNFQCCNFIIKGFLKWMLTDGQNMTEALDYAKLPKLVVDKEMKAIAKIQ